MNAAGQGALDLAPWEDGTALRVKVRAHARQNALAGIRDGALRAQVTAAPEKGQANGAVLALLARALGVPPSALALLSGAANPAKRIGVRGLGPGQVAERLRP